MFSNNEYPISSGFKYAHNIQPFLKRKVHANPFRGRTAAGVEQSLKKESCKNLVYTILYCVISRFGYS